MKTEITQLCRSIGKRRLVAYLTLMLALCLASGVRANSFVPAHDTIRISAAVGSTASSDVVITDLLDSAITIKASIYASNMSLWHLASAELHIGADTTHTGHFSVSFAAPSTSGTYTASLRLSDSIHNTLVYVTLIGTATGGQTTPVLHAFMSGTFSTNVDSTLCHPLLIYAAIDSGASITVTSAALTDSNSVWSLSLNGHALPLTLTHGMLDSLIVCFDPTAVMEYHDSVVIRYTDTHGTSQVVYIPLVGNGTHTTATPVLHAFVSGTFSTTVDSTLCHPLLIYAAIDSGASITVTSAALTDSNSVWSLSLNGHALPLTLTHGMLDSLIVCFDPTAVMEYHDSVVIRYTDNHGTSQVVYVPLVGNGTHPEVACFRISGDTSSMFGVITAGTSQSRTLELSNPTSHAWVITAIHSNCDSAVWSVSGIALPDTLASNSSTHFSITFHAPSATTNERYACTFQFYANSGSTSCEQGLNVRGYSKPDTAEVSLAPDTTQSIAFEASLPGVTYKYVRVKNNTGHRVKVEGISLLHATHFSVALVYPDSTIPFYLSGDGSMYIKITLTDTGSGLYADTLQLTTEYGIAALSVPISALVTPMTESVTAPVAPLQYAISVNPNPSNGAVTVSLGEMRHTLVQIYDVLGHLVWQKQDAQGSIRWNGESFNGGTVTTGAYILRATGTLPNGAKAIASARISVRR